MLQSKTVTGTCLVEETTHLYDLTIAPEGKVTAPEGKFIAMTVDGIGCDPKPRSLPWRHHPHRGGYLPHAPHALMRLNNISREFMDAVVIDSGKVVRSQCVPALIQSGTVTGEKAENVYLASTAESFNGILVTATSPIWSKLPHGAGRLRRQRLYGRRLRSCRH